MEVMPALFGAGQGLREALWFGGLSGAVTGGSPRRSGWLFGLSRGLRLGNESGRGRLGPGLDSGGPQSLCSSCP